MIIDIHIDNYSCITSIIIYLIYLKYAQHAKPQLSTLNWSDLFYVREVSRDETPHDNVTARDTHTRTSCSW